MIMNEIKKIKRKLFIEISYIEITRKYGNWVIQTQLLQKRERECCCEFDKPIFDTYLNKIKNIEGV